MGNQLVNVYARSKHWGRTLWKGIFYLSKLFKLSLIYFVMTVVVFFPRTFHRLCIFLFAFPQTTSSQRIRCLFYVQGVAGRPPVHLFIFFTCSRTVWFVFSYSIDFTTGKMTDMANGKEGKDLGNVWNRKLETGHQTRAFCCKIPRKRGRSYSPFLSVGVCFLPHPLCLVVVVPPPSPFWLALSFPSRRLSPLRDLSKHTLREGRKKNIDNKLLLFL